MRSAFDRLSPTSAALLLAFAALALRAVDFGNPVVHVDEQYYLLVGNRVLHGALPYIDIWDRKPIGLFLIYAALAALPGDGILTYQLAATAFAAATAWLVFIGARLSGATRGGALAAGFAYLVWLSLLGGRGGQAPVFYDLPVTAAAVLVLRLPALARAGRRSSIVTHGTAACLLMGISIQIKPTALFEALFVAGAHLWFLRQAGARFPTLLAAAMVMVAGISVPTLAAMVSYLRLGPPAFDAWWFANVRSILLRPGYPAGQLAMRLLGIGAQLSPLIVCAAIGWRFRDTAARDERRLAFAWLGAATIGFFAIGTFFDHYALPLIAPLAITGAATLGRAPRATVGSLGLALVLLVIERGSMPDDRAGARSIAAVVAANSGRECPYVFIGDTITYHLAHACLPTAYAFPNLLAYAAEQGATGIDEAAEVRRILAARPPVIVTSTRELAIWNRGSIDALKMALRSDYRAVYSAPRARYRTIVYLRNDRPYRRP